MARHAYTNHYLCCQIQVSPNVLVKRMYNNFRTIRWYKNINFEPNFATLNKLSIFFIRSFVGPFFATFFISMFMLVMQFLWKYIDDLMGKGLETSIIIELLFYVSASLLPLALPLAILLSSIITLGNLAENNELTALKSSGLSIYKIVRPLSIVVLFIAIGTFYFSNYIIPVANFKWHSIIWDIQETKLSAFLKPGSYTSEIDGFSIKIKDGHENKFNNIIIHDRRDASELKTITADSGEYYRSVNGDYLFFKLYNGKVNEEVSQESKLKILKNKKNNSKNYVGRKSKFKTATYKMNLTGFEFNRSKDELFKNDFEMLNVFQIEKAVDSMKQNYYNVNLGLVRNTIGKHAYFQSIKYKPLNIDTTNENTLDSIPLIPTYNINAISNYELKNTLSELKTQLRTKINSLQNQLEIEESKNLNLQKFEIEFHRKFALSFSIIILFFIGAPLGAIVKKGGFGAPVVIASLLFMIYFVIISIGDNMASEQVISPFLGMWGANFILAPFAIILMSAASKDKSAGELFKLNIKKNNP